MRHVMGFQGLEAASDPHGHAAGPDVLADGPAFALSVYRSIRRLGLWNPRLDTAWLLDVDRIGDGLRGLVDERIIGYPGSDGRD